MGYDGACTVFWSKKDISDKTEHFLSIGDIHAATSKPGNGNVGWILEDSETKFYIEKES